MPAKRVIVLERLDAAQLRYRVAFWADVPAARRPFYAEAGRVSAWTGASAIENDALSTGAVAERVDVLSFPAGLGLAAVQASAQADWQRYQDEITAVNPWLRYGTFWDGAAWTLGGVA